MAPVRDFIFLLHAIVSSHLFIVLDSDDVPPSRHCFVTHLQSIRLPTGFTLSRRHFATEAHPECCASEIGLGLGVSVCRAFFMVGSGKVGSRGFDFVSPSSRSFGGEFFKLLRLIDL